MSVETPGGTFKNPGIINTCLGSKFSWWNSAVLGASIIFSCLLYLGMAQGPKKAFAAAPVVSPTPTVDRLAESTMPPNPDQADLGAQAYWLNCMPCHGDKGQGLTAEFRSLYPEVDRNCWESGCHGAQPYERGFKLPTSVPPIIGLGALDHFNTAGNLYTFIHASMPYQDPGSLDDETYWQLTAFLLRENGLLHSIGTLGPDNAEMVRINPGSTEAIITSAPAGSSGEQEAALTPEPTPENESDAGNFPYLVPVISLALVLVGFWFLLLRGKNPPSP